MALQMAHHLRTYACCLVALSGFGCGGSENSDTTDTAQGTDTRDADETPDGVSDGADLGDSASDTDASDSDTDAPHPDTDATGQRCGGTYDSPPANRCADANTVEFFQREGICEGELCTYPSELITCDHGCENGRCTIDHCAGILCQDAPSPCHEGIGQCQEGQCTYAFKEGASCDDGNACTQGDTCQVDSCVGQAIVCESPDEATCIDESTLGIPEASGQCVEGTCNYGLTPTPCAFKCEGGACVLPKVLISEILYDSSGAPDVQSFIELYGPPGLSLEGFSLSGLNGNEGDTYVTIPLSGVIGADGLFVMAHPNGSAAAQADALNALVDFQNGPDSVMLNYGEAVLDAIGYGTFSERNFFAGEGRAVAGHVIGQSLQRNAQMTDTDDNAADFSSQTPTPGALPSH